MIQDIITCLLILGALAWVVKGVYRIFYPGVDQRSCATGCHGCNASDQDKKRFFKQVL